MSATWKSAENVTSHFANKSQLICEIKAVVHFGAAWKTSGGVRSFPSRFVSHSLSLKVVIGVQVSRGYSVAGIWGEQCGSSSWNYAPLGPGESLADLP